MTSRRNVERRIEDLEDSPEPPALFAAAGRGAGLTDAEIGAAWEQVRDATPAGKRPISTWWRWELTPDGPDPFADERVFAVDADEDAVDADEDAGGVER